MRYLKMGKSTSMKNMGVRLMFSNRGGWKGHIVKVSEIVCNQASSDTCLIQRVKI